MIPLAEQHNLSLKLNFLSTANNDHFRPYKSLWLTLGKTICMLFGKSTKKLRNNVKFFIFCIAISNFIRIFAVQTTKVTNLKSINYG